MLISWCGALRQFWSSLMFAWKFGYAGIWKWSNLENFSALGQKGIWGLQRDFKVCLRTDPVQKAVKLNNRKRWKAPSHLLTKAGLTISFAPSPRLSPYPEEFHFVPRALHLPGATCHLVLLQAGHLGRAEWLQASPWLGICSSNPYPQRK